MITRRQVVVGGLFASSFNESGKVMDRPAHSAAAFIDSIGINIHLNYPSYAGRLDDLVVQRLTELGVRHVRDSIMLTDVAANVLQSVNSRNGLRATLLSSPITNAPDAASDLILNRFGKDVVAAIEGINEPDGWFSGQPAAHGEWAAQTLRHQRDLYRAIRSEPRLDGLPVIGPAVIDVSNVDSLNTISSFIDITNIHPYPGGRNPETEGWGAAQRGFNYGSVDWALANGMPRLQSTQPVIATETGYHNAIASVADRSGVPAWVAAIYLPRLFLYYFDRNIVRSFAYELLDERNDPHDPEACFGLLQCDGTPKPAFIALRNLISLLSDEGQKRSRLGRLHVTFESSNIGSVLLQKNNGSFYLAVWFISQIWAPGESHFQQKVVKPLHITFGQDVFDVAIAKPNEGVQWTSIFHLPRQIKVIITEQVTLIRLRASLTEKS